MVDKKDLCFATVANVLAQRRVERNIVEVDEKALYKNPRCIEVADPIHSFAPTPPPPNKGKTRTGKRPTATTSDRLSNEALLPQRTSDDTKSG